MTMETKRKMARRKLAWVFVLGMVITQLSIGTDVHRALAANLDTPDSPPTGTAYFVYVPPAYYSTDAQGRYWAYDAGFGMSVGGQHRVIVLDFGKQYRNDSNGKWGVHLVNSSVTHSMAMSAYIAQSFIWGYNDGHSLNQAAYIAIGTNNSEDGWTCDDNDTYHLDTRWLAAGTQWGLMVGGLTSYSKAVVKSANDFEAWHYNVQPPDPWRACGWGAYLWFDGFTIGVDQAGKTNMNNYHFGNEPYYDRPMPPVTPYPTDSAQDDVGGWTKFESWSVGNGFPTGDPNNPNQARVVPEIYCSAANAVPWPTIVAYATTTMRTTMYIAGVTSLNHTGTPPAGCSSSLTYPQSWSALATKVPGIGNVAISYCPSLWCP